MEDTPKMDHVPEASDVAGKRWWKALRRAYDVPDIVTDENALAHIVQEITGEPRSAIGIDDRHTAGSAAVWLVVDLGETGVLDKVLMGDIGPDDSTVRNASSRRFSAKLEDTAAKLSIAVIRKVCGYVNAHKWECFAGMPEVPPDQILIS